MSYKTLKKLLFKFDPETAHGLAEFGLRCASFVADAALQRAFCPRELKADLSQELFGKSYANPIGIAGGFDKNATMIRPLASLGFGFVEFGTFTPKPQSGNAKPRLFRLVQERSLQNAMGFNNEGMEAVQRNVSSLYPFRAPIWANVGKNKFTPNDKALEDYEILVERFSQKCDAFVLNISSPNTPNLRALQEEGFVSEAFSALKLKTTRPLALKLAPDIEPKKAVSLARAAVKSGAKILVCNNTSTDYSLSANAREFGGLSGELITAKSREFFDAVSSEVFGECVLVSCGGISNAKEAYERVKMGANLVEIFTSFIFEGPSVAKRLCEGLCELLLADGYTALSQAVGAKRRG